jgi:hypothetical protein
MQRFTAEGAASVQLQELFTLFAEGREQAGMPPRIASNYHGYVLLFVPAVEGEPVEICSDAPEPDSAVWPLSAALHYLILAEYRPRLRPPGILPDEDGTEGGTL